MPAIIPIITPTPADVLYGDRVTGYRWEVLQHSAGVDQLIGTLDGVAGGSLNGTLNAAVKHAIKSLQIVDLSAADTTPGMRRIAELSLPSVRLRPVQLIDGLPENPLGTYLVSQGSEQWDDTGRIWSMDLLERTTVPAQDRYTASKTVPAGTLILQHIKAILGNVGEYIEVDQSNTITTKADMAWEAGTTKLKVINDLLDVAGYNSLWMDGFGNFQTTPRVLPADRSATYEVLGIPRELVDGQLAIYEPSWNRNRDSYDVPNQITAVQAATGGDTTALTGTWTNTDPTSEYSTVTRGRTIGDVLPDVEVPDGTNAEIIAFLQQRARQSLIARSSTQAQVKLRHLPIPARVGDVLRFRHTGAGVDDKHVITQTRLDLSSLGLMSSTLQEVISL